MADRPRRRARAGWCRRAGAPCSAARGSPGRGWCAGRRQCTHSPHWGENRVTTWSPGASELDARRRPPRRPRRPRGRARSARSRRGRRRRRCRGRCGRRRRRPAGPAPRRPAARPARPPGPRAARRTPPAPRRASSCLMSTIEPMVKGRGARRLLPALAAALALAAVVAAGATAARGGDSVLVATTGSNSEMVKTVPITKNPGGQPRVVMSMRPSDVPSLLTGDRLDLTAEMQVTADCRTKQPRCAGRPYHFDPAVTAELLDRRLRERRRGRRRPRDLARPAQLDLPRAAPEPRAPLHDGLHRHHPRRRHRRAALPAGLVPPEPDAAGPQRQGEGGREADHRHQPPERRDQAGQGADQRRPPQSRLAAAIDPLVSEDRITTRLVPRMKQRVIYSQRLNGLEQGEQLAVKAKMRTGIGHLPYNTLISSVLVLTEGKRDTSPSSLAERVGSSNGEISERNGFNCTQRRTPCTTRKVGVLAIRDDAVQNGNPKPLFVNLVTYANAKRADSRAHDKVKVLNGGRLEVTRYPAGLRG